MRIDRLRVGAGQMLRAVQTRRRPLLDWRRGTFANASPRYIWLNGVVTGPYAGGVPAVRRFNGVNYYQSEAARENTALYNTVYSNAAWVKTSISVDDNSDPGPLGDTTADTLEFTASAGSRLTQTPAAPDDNKVYSFSTLHKLLSGNSGFRLTGRIKDNSQPEEVLTATAAWQRGSRETDVLSGGTAVTLQIRNANANAGNILNWGTGFELGPWPSSPIITAGAAVTRAKDSMSYVSGAYPAALLSGKYTIKVIPFHASADLANSEIHAVLERTGSQRLSLRKSSGGTAQVTISTAGGNLNVFCSWSRYSELLITVDFVNGDLTLSGFDTGDGTTNDTVSDWSAGTLYAGADSGAGSQFDGLIGEPEVLAA